MPILPFGLTWASADSGVETPISTESAPITWTRRTGATVDRRFNHLYAQSATTVDAGTDYIYRVQSQNPFFIATANGVLIASALTEVRP